MHATTPAADALFGAASTAALGGWLLVRMAELEMPERFSARTSTDAGR